ncbi:GNAT family N-acetyltransferase [Streptomyces sp. NBC_01637]|uniref:GNAT family N-acetyltransferase n=1 Tax=unclassified Streptomyces TaxID=2593676 RepID=UPI003869A145|nr:GNAT family N-acetyltransferase [Streptomyces sp. NBC_01653]WTC84552.1 GNAT family N-acetyltransferase [Streptomyces sp. NBC_01653]WTD86315.1 GNAT family N-acetyltransferase [Streptomyces sp. NBC_01637]WTD94209.1 GNAT family N-acetyltransferase [Streptomyces sp. NBC_01637]
MTPLNDPLRPVVLAYTATCETLSAAVTGRSERGSDGTVLTVSRAPVASLNGVISPNLDPDPEVIAALAGREMLEGLAWSIQVRGLPGVGVMEVAARYGLTHTATLPLMIRRPEAGLPPRPAAGGLQVHPVRGDEFTLYARTMADAFGVPHEAFEMFANPALADLADFTFYLAESDGALVGTGMAAVRGELLGVFNIGVLPRHRRQGHGRAITTEIVRAHYAAGATTAYLYASAVGESVYASAGFRTEESLTTFTIPT